MSNILQTLESNNLIHPPKYLVHSTQYLTRMGSVAYGVSTDMSDQDIYGWCIPPKEDVFPHLRGEIVGFGKQKQRFEQWQEHHIEYNLASYDLSVYNIVRFFDLAMSNNPNMVDSLFTPLNQVIHITQLGQMVREKRRLFLHKGCWFKFKGYAWGMLSKLHPKVIVVSEYEKAHNLQHGYTLDEVRAELQRRKGVKEHGRETA